ncbi:MAG: hypothetical protein A2V96_00840 [Candidatus Yonathbacteria bacterium RBG_16_43_6]|uniref:Solute-binding protein family 5 domain-containing protein n=2 Tax=Parcubacteria group TaxID=1794811 RepID=A0A1G2SEL0_9BACT|nr:MAG: hypothetical protein UW78_C0005G0026 [Candidatus Azambacteria bacterium GW2011_GWA1_44_9]OHA78929.1 MAG: hypothetical protein A2V96_00840 [Candidatus Yonathbacteria bacterium RBG_16_43_6]OHA79077.1 MAG: hypothetical protein A2658_01960 [Candidatus Yonathbacteria bacterium RIFCSPHIGHO2_01_FULL_44_19]OHA83079.1 MAG: hypothetical protein A3B07_00810 [Candidatus Yonathbacteria bacterium RIFCSPLOWO2_01_FULL_43_27]
MKNLLSSLNRIFSKRFILPFEGRFTLALAAFSNREKQIFFGAMGVLVGTTIVLMLWVNKSYIVPVPTYGGTLIEGVLNTPAHINPLLAGGEIGSEADRDISALVYSGLLRAGANGNFVPDLAERYEISDDGLSYTFWLKEDLEWHDGEKITADDIVFTIKTAQDSRMKSPKRASWDGVGVEKINDLTVLFTLKKPYVPFLENTTMGILPKHIWENVDFNRFDTNKYNREPIGSGPYKIDAIKTTNQDGDEIPVSYTLNSFKKFALGRPYVNTIKFVFAKSEDDLVKMLKDGTVDAINSISHEQGKILSESGYRVEHTPLPRVLAVFFNQNEAPIFAESAVREALGLSIDKQEIINKALAGYGVLLDTLLPPGALGYEKTKEQKPLEERLTTARTILQKAGWSFSEQQGVWQKKTSKETLVLRFTLATSEAPELRAVVEELKTSWAKLGVPVDIRVFATGDFKETIVRPRKFDALFFGQVLGRDSDPYPFWHSSQRSDPGLNIALYANTRVDTILTDARGEEDEEDRLKLYKSFIKETSTDNPAIPLYAPEFIYLLPQKINGVSLESVTIPSERFLNVYRWYIETDSVWSIFTR